MKTCFLIALLFLSFPQISSAEPPYSSSLSISPDIITEADPTTFINSVYKGISQRIVFDRRVNTSVKLNPFLFQVAYSDGLSVEIQINPEFESVEAARTQVAFYAKVMGRLPFSLRASVLTVTIHMGNVQFGGASSNIIIHTGIAQGYIDGNSLEEAVLHEMVHAVLDNSLYNNDAWLQAQQTDGEYISKYARDNSQEDLAESFLAWLAVRYRSDRISKSTAETIADTIPNRIAYFDGLNLNMTPITEGAGFLINAGLNDAWYNPATNGQGFLITVFPDRKEVFLAWFTYDTERPLPGSTAILGEPGHRWLTAQGPYAGDTANLTIYMTEGGVFDKAQPPATTNQDGYGTMTIEFVDCTEGLLSYEIPSLGLSGEIPIERIVSDNTPLCNTLAIQ